jgi:hypothetical protein
VVRSTTTNANAKTRVTHEPVDDRLLAPENERLTVELNPGAHEERSLRTCQQIFDRHERLDDDGLGGRDGEPARRDGRSAGR